MEKENAMSDTFRARLETFVNQYPGRPYEIEISCPEFTAVCPKTGQPDFGEIRIVYTPAERCIELKALKLYLQAYRSQGIFYEHVVNKILDDVVASCQPMRCKVIGNFRPRGGITTSVTATFPPVR
jgi:7-cyano-7-deazaguanine reductase